MYDIIRGPGNTVTVALDENQCNPILAGEAITVAIRLGDGSTQPTLTIKWNANARKWDVEETITRTSEEAA